MHRLLRSVERHRMLYLIIASNLALGCAPKKIETAELPEKPKVEQCWLNKDLGGLDCKTPTGGYYTKPYDYFDKYTCFHPDYWKVIGDYNIELRALASKSCHCD